MGPILDFRTFIFRLVTLTSLEFQAIQRVRIQFTRDMVLNLLPHLGRRGILAITDSISTHSDTCVNGEFSFVTERREITHNRLRHLCPSMQARRARASCQSYKRKTTAPISRPAELIAPHD
jgi:hypothetical protein